MDYFLRADSLISISRQPDWLQPLNYSRLACSSPLPPPKSTSSLYFSFFSFDGLSLLYFFIHETENSLSLIICLISSFPRSFTSSNSKSKRKLALALPSTLFWKIRGGQSLKRILLSSTSKEVLKRLVLLLYQIPLTVCRPVNYWNPLSLSYSLLLGKSYEIKDALQNLTRVGSSKGRTPTDVGTGSGSLQLSDTSGHCWISRKQYCFHRSLRKILIHSLALSTTPPVAS